ncbi:transposase [Alkalibacillus silvisoli]|uniref:Transposase IS200-like domain-containing protein n=1 Tax=Alkalibacillus silvisoli TaxID=392823 RepID=A0ABN1A7F1_9BACI
MYEGFSGDELSFKNSKQSTYRVVIKMPRKARVKSKTGIYHIMWRGTGGQDIFHDDGDRLKYLDTVLKYKKRADMSVYAWCLMSNHVHLLLQEGNEDISITMKRVGVSFASYYNWKYSIKGHLFQDRFKSENVENNQYLRAVVRYIHQNPLKAGIVDQVEAWNWSSCRGYYGKTVYPLGLLDAEFVLGMFSSDKEMKRKAFKVFNEKRNLDKCLDESIYKPRLSDEEARAEIRKILGEVEIPQIKGLPRMERNDLLKKVKRINGVSQRQAARILGVSPNLVFKA